MAAPRRSCSSLRSMRKLLLWLVLASLHAATEAATVTSNGNAIKKATSFVTPTFGSPHSLTLSTYLTDAADLHYAVVLSGHAPLDADAIKNAAEQCSAPLSPSSSSQSATEPASRRSSSSQQAANEQRDRLQLSEAVSASTVTVPKAQKVERHVSGLQPNTSYDVYFVAEVSGSNGVFGSVQSVLHSTTYPEPPMITITSLVPANDSATTLEVNATTSAPGRVYFAFVPSSAGLKSEQELSVADIVSNRSFSSELPSVFALHDQDDWVQSSFFKVVQGLTSATLYDVLLVAEALGDGGVRSAVVRLSGAARTHVLPPDVVRLVASPQDASAEALVVDFDLRFDSQDVLRASMENLRFFTFNIHYEAMRLEDSSPEGSFQPVAPAESTGGNPQAATVSESTDVVRGVFSFGNFSSVEQFQEQLATTQRGVIPGLLNGTRYRVTLAAETSSSHGLVDKQQSAATCKTHEQAPQILAASAKAVNGSVNALVVTTEMERRGGNVHYLVAERNAVFSIRNHLHDAKNMAHLVELVRGGRGDNAEVFSGKIEFDPNLGVMNASSNSYITALQVDGLRDATAYAIVVMPETHCSYGVFGKPFEQLLEAQTNENASQVTLHAVEPVFGSTSSVELFAEMTKPNDVLYYCLGTTGDTTAVNLNIEQRDSCFEANRTTFQLSRGVSPPPSFSGFSFAVGNLTEDTLYFVSIFAENTARNQVFSAATAPQLEVKTHKRAPALLRTEAKPVAASTDRIATTVAVSETCLVHYAIIETPADEAPLSSIEDLGTSVKNDTFPPPETIIKEKWMFVPSSSLDQHQRVQFVSQGHVFAANNALESFSTANLKANTSYTLFLTTETSLSGNTSGVYGDIQKVSVTTFATAPNIIKATVDPIADHIDSVFIAANLSTPGVVHYFLSDVDFADPAVIRKAVHRDGAGDGAGIEDDSNSAMSSTPHTLRGQFYVYAQDMAMEIINGTNDSKPVEPLMFVNNLTVGGLKSGVTYHVSLTTETFESDGVFGDFPPPILVTTHLPAPKILPPLQGGGSVVRPKPGSSSTLVIELELSRFGEVHYALFFRSLAPDRSDAVFEKQRLAELEALEASRKEAQSNVAALNETNATEPAHVWPPLSSEYSLANLNASLLKAAHFEDLGAGVWENGTISVSREDVLKGKLTVKEISKLPPNAIFDVCLVSETAGSDGIFDWESASRACHRVQTHADYSNQSVLFDEITVRPVDGMTGSIRIDLAMSKLLDAPTDTTREHFSILERFAVAAGRTPYFILADGKEARREFAYNSFSSSSNSRSRDKAAGFKDAVPGTNGVAAGGILTQIGSENATFLVLTQEIHELKPNHPYFLFFAYETSDSDGVFTKINPHKHRSNDSKTESDAIEVVTHEAAPVLTKFATVPTFGNTSTVTIQFDIACTSCKEAIVHALVYPEVCARPSIELLKAQQSGGG